MSRSQGRRTRFQGKVGTISHPDTIGRVRYRAARYRKEGDSLSVAMTKAWADLKAGRLSR